MSIGSLTQEDPIGLAGGLNLYGFANGDPVNFSDPFGLCPIPPESCLGPEGADLALGSTPLVSTGLDAVTLFSGTNVVTGEHVGIGGRLLAGVGLITPTSSGQIKAAGRSLGRIAAKIGNIIGRHLDRRHLSIAARELKGLETGFDHVTEVREAARGLRNTIGRLNGILGNPSLDDATRREAERLPSRASRALDAAERALQE